MLTWNNIKEEILKVTEDVKKDEFDGVNDLKNKVIEFFELKKFSNDELEQTKTLIKNLAKEIDNKSEHYKIQLSENVENVKNFNKYLYNIKAMDA